MIRKQIVIKIRRPLQWRGKDYGRVTDNKCDIFEAAMEAGVDRDTSEKIALWAEKAKDGEIYRPKKAEDSNGARIIVAAECRALKGGWF